MKMPIDVDGRIWYNNTEKMKIEDLEANTVMLERSVDHTRENVNIVSIAVPSRSVGAVFLYDRQTSGGVHDLRKSDLEWCGTD